uniref:(California timema) hypothetical protein n=1 Tax=Timema californicum TaxID=61474 RepID=A0A7R9JFF0_TIMCA|nr:unnamed protein product [Timema californicum]
MILSRAKPAAGPGVAGQSQTSGRKQVPKMEDFLNARDYTGALIVLEVRVQILFHNDLLDLSAADKLLVMSPTPRSLSQFGGSKGNETEMWIGYCAFHLGDYKRAMSVYEALTQTKNPPADVPTNLACCYFFLGMYPEAQRAVERAPASRLKTRLCFHLAHKLGDEKKLMEYHQQLEDIIEDQLSLASIHYLRSHYQEAIDIYKRILLDNRSLLISTRGY